MVACDQTDIAAAYDEEPLRGAHQVAVGERLEGAGAVNADQAVAREAQELFPRAGRVEDDLGATSL